MLTKKKSRKRQQPFQKMLKQADKMIKLLNSKLLILHHSYFSKSKMLQPLPKTNYASISKPGFMMPSDWLVFLSETHVQIFCTYCCKNCLYFQGISILNLLFFPEFLLCCHEGPSMISIDTTKSKLPIKWHL